jgi:hypothetical protein
MSILQQDTDRKFVKTAHVCPAEDHHQPWNLLKEFHSDRPGRLQVAGSIGGSGQSAA